MRFAILRLCVQLRQPDFIHLVFIFTLPGLYGVCMLSQLNARSQWQAQLSGEQTYHGWVRLLPESFAFSVPLRY